MKVIFLKIFPILLLLSCPTRRHLPPTFDKKDCGNAYHLSEIYFNNTDRIELPIRFVKFSDSIGEINNIDFEKVVQYINKTYIDADVIFRLDDTVEIISPLIKGDMPSFVKYAKAYYKAYAVTCYIYGNTQENFPDDLKGVLGIAAGVGSTFFAIREQYILKSTLLHELGHCLGLYHYDTPDDTDGYTIYSGDKVCDTRSANNLHEKISGDCKYVGIDADSIPEADKTILSCNLMSWAYLHCRGCLTDGQMAKVRFTIHEHPELRENIRIIR